MVLPALTEATSPSRRPVKYALFPPLGLATLAGYLRPDDEVTLHDEHVQKLRLDDDRPDLAVIGVYITSARRAYQLAGAYRARGVYVALGGLHVTSLPEEAAQHADSIFLGPAEDTWPVFLDDFPGNVAAARRLGMHGVLVEDDPRGALAELERLVGELAASAMKRSVSAFAPLTSSVVTRDSRHA